MNFGSKAFKVDEEVVDTKEPFCYSWNHTQEKEVVGLTDCAME